MAESPEKSQDVQEKNSPTDEWIKGVYGRLVVRYLTAIGACNQTLQELQADMQLMELTIHELANKNTELALLDIKLETRVLAERLDKLNKVANHLERVNMNVSQIHDNMKPILDYFVKNSSSSDFLS